MSSTILRASNEFTNGQIEQETAHSGQTRSPFHTPKAVHGERVLYSHLQQLVPSIQRGVITPSVGQVLNMRYENIPVPPPEPGEVVVRIAWTGICRSVSLKSFRWY